MNLENNFEQIEKYLDGSMSEAEIVSFQKALSEDATLRQAVDFQRNIETILARKPEDGLRKNLAKLNEKYSSTPQRNNKKWWLGFVLIALIGLAFWYFQKLDSETNLSKVEEPQQETEMVAPAGDSLNELPEKKAEKLEEIRIKPSENSQKVQEKTPEKETAPQPKEAKPAPIAADFTPNKLLENRLGNLRGGKLTIQNFKDDFGLKDGKINFALQGFFSDDVAVEETENISLYIFNNKKSDYEEFKPVYTNKLIFKKSPDGYAFKLTENLELKAGLYYVQIENDAGAILFLEKILVK